MSYVPPDLDPSDPGSSGALRGPSLPTPPDELFRPPSAPPYPNTVSCGFHVRLFSAAKVRKPLVPRTVGPPRWNEETFGGFADFSMPLYLDDPNVRSISETDYLEFWDAGVLQYRGKVTQVTPKEGQGPAVCDVTGYGRMSDLTTMLARGVYEYAGYVDVSIPFAEMASEVQLRYPDIAVEVNHIGVLMDTLDATYTTMQQAMSDLLTACVGKAVFGFDVDQYGSDRLYLRKVDTTTPPDFTVPQPASYSGSRESKRDVADVVNSVLIKGGPAKYPQLQPNGSFEQVQRPGLGSQNLANNPGFETQSPLQWTMVGGASVLHGDEDGKPAANSGNYMCQLDNIGEACVQNVGTPTVALVPGDNYRLSFYCRPEQYIDVTSPPVVTATLSWTNSSGAIIAGAPQGVVVTPADNSSQAYKPFECFCICPTGYPTLTGFDVRIEATSGTVANTKGVCIDDVALNNVSLVDTVGWELTTATSGGSPGGAEILGYSWAALNAKDGRRCLFVDVSSSDSDGHDAKLSIRPQYFCPVTGGTPYEQLVFVKGHNGGVIPKIFLETQYFNAKGQNVGNNRVAFGNDGLSVVDWKPYQSLTTSDNNAVKAEVYVTFRGTGKFYIDCLSFREYEADDYVSGDLVYIAPGNMTYQFNAEDLVTAVEDYNVHHSFDVYGRREKVQSAPVLVRYADIKAAAKSYLLSAAWLSPGPIIELMDDWRLVRTWNTLLVSGELGDAYGAGLTMAVGRITVDYGGGRQSRRVEVSRPVKTLDDIMRGFLQQINLLQQTTTPGAASLPAASVAGSTPLGVEPSYWDAIARSPTDVTLHSDWRTDEHLSDAERTSWDDTATEVVNAHTSSFFTTVYSSLLARFAAIETYISGLLKKSNNLSDLASSSTARTNLGLGTSSTRDVPASGDASSTQVVLGNDSRLSGGGGGGGGFPTIYRSDNLTATGADAVGATVTATPTSWTIFAGLTVTIAASAVARVFLCWADLNYDKTGYAGDLVFGFGLDADPNAGPVWGLRWGLNSVNMTANKVASMGPFPISIPGDSAPHVVTLYYQDAAATQGYIMRANSIVLMQVS